MDSSVTARKISRNKLYIGVSFIVLAFFGSSVFLYNDLNKESQKSTSALLPKNTKARVIKVKGGNYYYEPKEIRIKLGENIRIEFTNTGGYHDLKIDEFNVATNLINAGETGSFEFNANKKGNFIYYCSYTNHRQLGQAGFLIVE